MNQKKTDLSSRLVGLALGMAIILVYWAHTWQAHLKLDGMTYGVIARNILDSGKWLPLHYSDYIYNEFYQHPPLAFWIQSVFFNIFGVSDTTARFFPFLCVVLIFILLTKNLLKYGATYWQIFIASFVLLTSTRFIKFTNDFYLDTPLSLLLLCASLCFFAFDQSKARTYFLKFRYLFGFSTFLAAAFLTKGLTALGILPATLGYIAYIGITQKNSKKFWNQLLFLAGGIVLSGILLLPWLYLGQGWEFMERYWNTSVSYRISAKSFSDQLGPVLHLMKVYWPWWPILVYSIFRIINNRKNKSLDELAIYLAINGVTIVAAFSWVGHFIEFYFVPFYMFVATVIALEVSRWKWLRVRQVKVVYGFSAVIIIASFIFAIFPIELHGKRGGNFSEVIEKAESRCLMSKFNKVYFTKKTGYIWYNLALVQWRFRGAEGFHIKSPKGAQTNGDNVLIAHSSETVSNSWKLIERKRNMMYYTNNASICNH